MAIKGGDLIHVGNQILIDRAQTAGPGQVNIPTEKIYELGNYFSVAQIRDIPDLTFSLDSLDVSAEFESLLVGADFTGMTDGTELLVAKSLPIDVASEFKAGFTAASPYNVVGSVATPYLALETLSYKFGVSDKATQSATLKGDSCYYSPGSTYIEETAGSNAANQDIPLAHKAYPFNGDVVAGTRYTLSVCLASGHRLSYGSDFTETVTGTGDTRTVHVIILAAVPTTDKVRIIYASDTVAAYPQVSHAAASATRPAAIKGRDIEVFIGGTDPANRWTSVQSVQIDYKVTLNADLEFGNAQIVAQDYDVPDVSGSVEIKPRDYAELYDKVAAVANLATRAEVAGPLTTAPLELLVKLHSPDDGSVIKALYVPDARFTFPGMQGQVQQKQTVTFNFDSDTGDLRVYKGDKP
jgi:hypothetical protein